MIATELRLIDILFLVLCWQASMIVIGTSVGRCYLCSQKTLPACAGRIQSDSSVYLSILQYYTEPCNGQCVLFRNEEKMTVRGCSWTYGHMMTTTAGWHELAPGIKAYFCDSPLCNNGTVDEPEKPTIKKGMVQEDGVNLSLQQILNAQQLLNLAANNPTILNADQALNSIDTMPRPLRQCYSCSARLAGCGEYLDARFLSMYIRPCAASCVIFRNPNDFNLITRGCSTTWPQVHAKSGLHKLLGADAFFCQESLCNGISFDFIMGIFHNQLPTVIKFPPIENMDVAAPVQRPTIGTTTTTDPISTTMNIDETEELWEDPESDVFLLETTTTTTTIMPTTTITMTIPITSSTTLQTFPEFFDLPSDAYELSSTAIPSFEHFDFNEEFKGVSSTISGGLAVAQQDLQLNWWDFNEASFPTSTMSTRTSASTTSTRQQTSTTYPVGSTELDEWSEFQSNTIPSTTYPPYLLNSNSDFDFDMNGHFFMPKFSTMPAMTFISHKNKNNSFYVPYYHDEYQAKEDLFNLMKPSPTMAMPPFAWMLNLANRNRNQLEIGKKNFKTRIFSIATLPTTTTTTTAQPKVKRIQSRTFINNDVDYLFEFCHKKQCQNGGYLNSTCSCLCLPAFRGVYCEIVQCDQQPAHICDFVLEKECRSDYVRHLCPKFCQMTICSSSESS